VKLNKLGRIGLIVTWFTLTALSLSAQSGGYSYLEFVENKGQWDSSVRFQARMPAGNIFMQHKGFTVLMEDTTDLLRIGELLHGDFARAGVSAPSYPSHPGGGWATSGGTGGLTAGAGKPAVTGTAITPAMVNAPAPHQILPPGNGGGGGTGGAKNDPFLLHLHSYRVSFVGANDEVTILPDKAVASYNNYFIGDKKNWAVLCKIYQGILYKDMYKGIDIHYYTDAGTLKYDIVVHPGADPNQVILQYDGQTKLSVRKNKIYVQTTAGTVQELEPHSYQVDGSGRSEVACSYKLLPGNRIRFSVGNYSPDATLVIDPTEVFCSFTGSRSDNWGYTATYDGAGNLYLGGIVLDETDIGGSNGNGYLVSPGAFQTTFQGGDASEGGPPNGGYQYDVGIMKLSANGANRIFATYLGGIGDEQPHSMIVDASGDLIVTGRTSSSNFPLMGAAGPYGPGGGFDLFITKFKPDGTGLIGSRRIGGKGDDGVNYAPKYVTEGAHDLRLNYGDDGRSEIILDAAGNIYLAACTQSTDFPVTPGVFEPNAGGGGQDGVLLKLSPNLASVTFSSYLGGSNLEVATVLALSPADNSIWVAGGTLSTDFPGTRNAPVVQPANAGGIDGYIAQVSNDGSTLIKSSYYGSGLTDMIYGIAFDKQGDPYVMGTTSGLIPVVNSPFNSGGNQASGKQFITKFKLDLSGIVYSANFGPGGEPYPSISPTAFLVDRCENVYVSGWGGGPNIYERYTGNDGESGVGTNGLTATANALRKTTDDNDFYFFVLQKNAASQLYGSFFGQVGGVYGDHVDGGTSRFDAQGVIYEAICANCYGGATFPTTLGVFGPGNGTDNRGQTTGCNEAGVKIAFNFAGVAAGLKTVTHGRGDSVGCVPLAASFSDTIRNAKSYIWIFGDGTPPIYTTNFQENHTYLSTGIYKVTLIAIDSNSCNVADTAYHQILVNNNPATINFDYAKVPPCTSLSYVFTNLSTSPPAVPFGDSSFSWSFGDGTAPTPDGPSQITHSFLSPGAYNVTLSLIDTNYCNYPLDTTELVNVAQNVKAQFITPAIGCAPDSAIFNNTTIGGETYYWTFGDNSGIDSTDVSPVHFYPDPGTYTITLLAVNPNTCNKRDSTTRTITLYTKPTADFSYQPLPSQVNTPTVFVPTSSPAVRYLWEFGDGSSEVKATPDTVIHQYIRTDTFQVCMLVTNAEGCTDTVCHPVSALINPLLDVPNAFTPGRFGTNAIVKVVGFGIVHMTWRIYNRWGQVVFQSDDPNIGWDGYYRGQIQPMDVYAYTLEVDFSDGTHARKKGDITLIR
jgi:gliding motility-associated-like protein